MKKLLAVGIVILLGLGLMLSFSGIIVAQDDEYTVITDGFSVDQSGPGHNIPRGAVIHQLKNGITEVYNRDNSLILKASDSEAEMIPTPSGLARATYVYTVPSGCDIESRGNVTDVYQNGSLILRVINAGALTFPQYSGWIEQANNWSVKYLDYFGANWVVPSSPPNQGTSAVDFLFNAIEPQSGTAIIQPVLEWNQAGSHGWTLRSWYGPVGVSYFASAPINASTGNSISGTMSYDRKRGWQITTRNNSTFSSTSIRTKLIGNKNLAVFCALEGYYVTGDSDVPGTTTFDNMNFKYNNQSVNITWNPYISTGTGLTGLNVEIVSASKVILHTANQ
jgi:hypothetical protein